MRVRHEAPLLCDDDEPLRRQISCDRFVFSQHSGFRTGGAVGRTTPPCRSFPRTPDSTTTTISHAARMCPHPHAPAGGVVLLPAGAVPIVGRIAAGAARFVFRPLHVGGPVVRAVPHLLPTSGCVGGGGVQPLRGGRCVSRCAAGDTRVGEGVGSGYAVG